MKFHIFSLYNPTYEYEQDQAWDHMIKYDPDISDERVNILAVTPFKEENVKKFELIHGFGFNEDDHHIYLDTVELDLKSNLKIRRWLYHHFKNTFDYPFYNRKTKYPKYVELIEYFYKTEQEYLRDEMVSRFGIPLSALLVDFNMFNMKSRYNRSPWLS